MGLVVAALRRPMTVMVCLVAIALGAALALSRMPVDIFPALNLPLVYVCQPYGGMDPAQMEGLLTNYYEYHFLYISGIHHIESKNVQGMALMKLVFHPGTNMSQAMAETIAYVNRSRAFMPAGTVPPFVMRFDTGSVAVGYLVLSSETRSLGEIQDLALFRVRPMFASLPGVSAPPPFGGSQRTVVFRVDPERLRTYRISPEEVIAALSSGNTISPSGNMRIGDEYPIVPVNALVRQISELGDIPVRRADSTVVYLRDLGRAEDASDLTTGFALVNGRRAVYILATKRADASTLSVVHAIKGALPEMQNALPEDIKVSFEFDQSPLVTGAIRGLATEAALGAILTGLMVLVFLRDWRSALVVVVNIPMALLAATIGLWLTGNTINVMTLAGLALAVGILVDEATVEIENIHAQLRRTDSVALAVRRGNYQTAVPRLLAMLCVLAVFAPSVFMQGAAYGLFVPLSLAVSFAMIASYILSSTLVPVLSVWLLRTRTEQNSDDQRPSWFDRLQQAYGQLLASLARTRWILVPVYLGLAALVVIGLGRTLGIDIFPRIDAGEFRIRLRAPDGTHFEKTERIALDVLRLVEEEVGKNNLAITLGYVGSIPSSYPINAVYQWSRGPEEAILRVALRRGGGVRVEALKEKLRGVLAAHMPTLRVSFEPADLISEVMSFGSATPIEVAINGPNLAENRAFADKLLAELRSVPGVRDLQISQSLDYPTVDVRIDREKAGYTGVEVSEIARSLVAATSSSRFVAPVFWPDPKTGIGYQVQIEIPQSALRSADELGEIPVKRTNGEQVLLRDVARIEKGRAPGQFDRYNMKREVAITANITGVDLASVARSVSRGIARAGEPPRGSTLAVRGQIPPFQDLVRGLMTGLALAVLAIFLLLAAYFQSLRLPLVAVSAAPAVLAGSTISLWLTGSTLNIQSFIGGIMALGVAMANAILLLTFAEHRRREIHSAGEAAIFAGVRRLRPILMTTLAMTAGMLPLALGIGEGGDEVAPLGRAVVGGLLAATFATLLILPAVFTLVMGRSVPTAVSLDPTDPASRHFVGTTTLTVEEDEE